MRRYIRFLLTICAGLVAATSGAQSAGLVLESPLDYQVFQRHTADEGRIHLRGRVPEGADSLAVRLIGQSAAQKKLEHWQAFGFDMASRAFDTSFAAPAGGWYQLEVQARGKGELLGEASVAHVGIGEVFVIAGQSNSTNCGEVRLSPASGRVATFDGERWRLADDPQPGAQDQSTGGSFIPAFGDALQEKYNVPVGVACVGHGGTSVRQWLPAGERYDRKPSAEIFFREVGPNQYESDGKLFGGLTERIRSLGPNGLRAVLWHQGESDATQHETTRNLPGKQYFSMMKTVIERTNREAGWQIPWITAQVSYHNVENASDDDIRAAQQRLWDEGITLPGPDTDTLTGLNRDTGGKGIHFSEAGLKAHGKLWAEKAGTQIERLLEHGADPLSAAVPTESEAERERRMAWFREARYGMFIHWGPVSLSGLELSWGRGRPRPFDIDGDTTRVVKPEYDELYRRYDPVKFNADEWVRIAKDAGMRYIVLVSKHHDGFSNFDTKLSDYDIEHTPFKRDIVGELAAACKRGGLRFGLYYSQRDWTHPDYGIGDNSRYEKFMLGQVRELLTNYGKLDIMWWDSFGRGDSLAFWHGERALKLVKELQPEIVINDRGCSFAHRPPALLGDYDTPEERIGAFQHGRAWESCMTLVGGQWSWKPDGKMYSRDECLRILINTATGDGNLLLNIGPMPTGEIEPRQVARLKEIGDWLKEHGESIYGTRGGPYRNGDWGGSTYRGNTLYLHVFQWNGNTLRLPALKGRVQGCVSLGGGDAVCEQTAEGLTIKLPTDRQTPPDTVLKLTLDGPVEREITDGKPLDISSLTKN